MKCSLILADILLQYHDKELFNHLKHHKLVMEMYATNWFLTLFTRCVGDLSLLYELWEIFLFERDKYLLFYMAVGLLKTHRKKLLEMTQFENILKYLTVDLRLTDHE